MMEQKLDSKAFDEAVQISDRLVDDVRVKLKSILRVMRSAATTTPPPESWKLLRPIWTLDRMLGGYQAFFSQLGQDKYLEKNIFKGKFNGTFVDIGGHDGLDGSNTLFFELFRNWSGLCIEAAPSQYKIMTRTRTAECMNVAISDFEGEAEFLEVTKGLHQMGGLVEDLRPSQRSLVDSDEHSVTQRIKVPVTTFDKVAKERKLRKVDFCSIDVEGAELKVLRGIDFEYTDISVFAIENPPYVPGNFESVRRFMRERDYRLEVSLGEDDIFVKRDTGSQ